jgi:hypothetical protein
MVKILSLSSIGILACVMLSPTLNAQSAQPTVNILFKTLMIKTEADAGTMFAIDVDNREYWLTAKHILTGRKTEPAGEVKAKTVTLDVLDPVGDTITWNSVKFAVMDPGKDVDIVVLVPDDKLQDIGIPALQVSSASIAMGGECSFLGFPYATTWTATFTNANGSTAYKMPFIKHCYVSGMIAKPLGVIVLDGINNPGFSGGPVLYNTGTNQVVIGVVSSFESEAGKVHEKEVPNASTAAAAAPSDKKPKAQATKKENVVDLNTGIIWAYPPDKAVAAIKGNPIGRPIEMK